MELMQIEGVGAVKMGKLVDAGVKTIKQLSKLEFFHIERLLSRNPPFGHQVLHQLAGYPKLALRFEILGEHEQLPEVAQLSAEPRGKCSSAKTWMARIILRFDNDQLPLWRRRNPWTTLVIEGEDGRLVWFWRGSVKRMAQGKEIVALLHAKKGEALQLSFACEEVVGTLIRDTCKV